MIGRPLPRRVCSYNSVTEASVLIVVPFPILLETYEAFISICSNFRYEDEKLPWMKVKRTLYNDPCETEKHVVKTITLDTNGCTNCVYYPSELTEVKCSTSNILSGRNRASCNYNIDGDCLDIFATVRVLKVLPSYISINSDITYKVGCACHVRAGL